MHETPRHFARVIDDLVELLGKDKTKADLARFLEPQVQGKVRLQDINNWRNRGIPVAKCDSVERAFDNRYPKHKMRPSAFAPRDADAAA